MKLLVLDRTTVESGTLIKSGATVEFDDSGRLEYIRIKIDANTGDPVEYVIHELLHVVFHEVLLWKVDETIEEIFILALDEQMYDFVKSSKQRLAKWNALINEKLNEDVEPRPVAELVDRRADEARNEETG